MNPDAYVVSLTRAQLDLIATGLVELPAKHVMDLLGHLQQTMREQDEARAQRDAPKAPTIKGIK